jgi:hypothetical protein
VLIAALLAGSAILATESPLPSSFAQTSEQDNLCGSVVTENIELTADLTCKGDGIKVQGNNLLIHLNGFAMRGSGSDSNTTGILVEGSTNVEIKGPGMISLFGTGLEYSKSTGGAARDLYIGNNEIGVRLNSVKDTQVKQNHVADNHIGVLNTQSENTQIENSQMNGNDEGIRVENSQSVDVDFNVVMDGLTGIYFDPESTKNNIFYNVMFRNEQLDMNLASAQSNDTGNLLGFNECTQGNPVDVCKGRVLPSGQRLGGSTQSGESAERASTTQPEVLTPEAQQAADEIIARIQAGESQDNEQASNLNNQTAADR